MNTTQQQKGFTIIEVVLVLAIAGLIFAMIFVAWPALQRGQRDTARKNDVAALAGALGTWKSNNKGRFPVDAGSTADAGLDDFRDEYIRDKLNQYDTTASDPQTDELVIEYGGNGFSGGKTRDVDTITVYTRAICDDNNNAIEGNSRQAAVVIKLESGGFWCQEV